MSYRCEFEKLYAATTKFTYRHFKKRLIPFTDVEDVAIESVEKTMQEDEHGAFKSAKNREHRYEMMKNRAENHVRNAAKARRTQRALISINAFDHHIRESERHDEDGADREIEMSEFNRNEALLSDGGRGAALVREKIAEGKWLGHFHAAEKQVTSSPSDEKSEYLRLKRRCGLSKAKPHYLPAERRERALNSLRRRFRLSNELYHRELAAQMRRENKGT